MEKILIIGLALTSLLGTGVVGTMMTGYNTGMMGTGMMGMMQDKHLRMGPGECPMMNDTNISNTPEECKDHVNGSYENITSNESKEPYVDSEERTHDCCEQTREDKEIQHGCPMMH